MSDFFQFLADHQADLWEQVREHLWLTLLSVTLSVLVGLALGVAITKNKRLAPPILAVVNGVQTIPSIALLGVLLPLVGIGVVPAIIALFLYGLLPIVRNTHAGITGVAPSVIEAARGMGFSAPQQFWKIELPLATPVIFAGVRTAVVINIGIATLCALIAAGGLGEFIFRGLSTNNPLMILAGAIPASIMALLFDALLGYLQPRIFKVYKWAALVFVLSLLILTAAQLGWFNRFDTNKISAGFPSEFIERGDGYLGLKDHYNLDFDVNELAIGLMYDAVKVGEVDVISGFSTDGRILAYDLMILEDDRMYFPPYYAAPLYRMEMKELYPEATHALNKLSGLINDSVMAAMNYMVDEEHRSIREVAKEFLEKHEFVVPEQKSSGAMIHIGSKDFTESYILAHIFKAAIEAETPYSAELHLGFGGTPLIFNALRFGEIDLYPEYTGTGLLVLLPEDERRKDLAYQRDSVYSYVKEVFTAKYRITWGQPLGFNNTFALMMRRSDAESRGYRKISDLATGNVP